jgi:polyphosphate kinase
MTILPLFNRELSRLDYNRRVLAKAGQEDVPLLDRLRFLAYCARNMDEFFMVRAGSIRDRIDAGIEDPNVDGLTPEEQMTAIRQRTGPSSGTCTRCSTTGSCLRFATRKSP